MYIMICKAESQWEFVVWFRELKPAFSVNLEGWDGEVRQVEREGTYVYLCLIHVDRWQKATQYCKVIILQLKLKKKRSGHVLWQRRYSNLWLIFMGKQREKISAVWTVLKNPRWKGMHCLTRTGNWPLQLFQVAAPLFEGIGVPATAGQRWEGDTAKRMHLLHTYYWIS